MSTRSDRIDRLYNLLPVVHRLRDAEQGEPLRALLQVIAEQVNAVEDDITQLYDNWFIETCEDWVVPYLADLLGWDPVRDAGEPGDVATERQRARNAILIPRKEVARTIANRRRKGTLALLERLANEVAGWPARAIEFYRQLNTATAVNHLQAGRSLVLDVGEGGALDHLNSAFDDLAHFADVRRIGSHHTAGYHNTANVGLFVWRLRAYSVTFAPAYCVEDVGPNCFTFSILANDTPLFTRPIAETDPNTIAGPLNVPAPIRRRAFEGEEIVDGRVVKRASPDYYGVVSEDSRIGQSLAIWAPGWPPTGTAGRSETDPVPRARVIPADLTDWAYAPPRDHVAVDPVLGRIAFPVRQAPRDGVRVSYHYGFPADMGAGEYRRVITQARDSSVHRVSGQDQLREALTEWQRKELDPESGQVNTVIEITDSSDYVLPIRIRLAAGHTLQIRAANRTRPVIRLLDWQTERPDHLTVMGGAGSHFALDGVLVTGRGIHVTGGLASVRIRHATLVPGWSLDPDCEPRRPAEPSIEMENTNACLVIENSIVGSIQVTVDEVGADPVIIRIRDSIVDATGADCDGPTCEAIGAPGSALAHATLRIARSTVIGRVMVHAIELGENSIFMGRVTVARRQLGCVRFSYVRPGSRTPRRFHCQPDLVEQAIDAELSGSPDNVIKQGRREERERVRPRFTSTRYGHPAYCQLALHCAPEIVRGADDESEMGVYHDLFQPQRTANLRARLEEYAPAASETGIIFVS